MLHPFRGCGGAHGSSVRISASCEQQRQRDDEADEDPHLEGGERGPISQQKADPLLDLEDLEARPLGSLHGISHAPTNPVGWRICVNLARCGNL
jgi:hypothetical protein